MQVDGHIQIARFGPENIVFGRIVMLAVRVVVDQCPDKSKSGHASLELDGGLGRITYRKNRKCCKTSRLRALPYRCRKFVVAFLTVLGLGASCKM
jgi:hypothetical protein